MFRALRFLFFSGLIVFSGFSAHAEIKVGDTLTSVLYKDQFDKEQTITKETRLIFFGRTKESSSTIARVLEKFSQQVLSERHFVYLADISGMPGLIARMFALPKMKKYPFLIFLDNDGKKTQEIPNHDDEVTVLALKELKIESIEFVSPPEKLTSLIEAK